MSPGPAFGLGSGNSVMTPAGVIRPILLALNSENQMLPSGPAARARGPLAAVGGGGSGGPPGPAASARGPLSAVGIGYSVITPAGVIFPIFPAPNSPNQMLPSAPSAI